MMLKVCIPVPLLLLLLPTVCEGTVHLRKLGQHYGPRNWKNAQIHCRESHTDLVTIRSNEENENFRSGYGWIGLHQRNSEWKWSRGDEKANFTNWDINEPRSGQNCAYKLRWTNKWRTNHCHRGMAFMCDGDTLTLIKELKTWEQALEHCRALEALDPSKPATAYQNHRYDLASLLTAENHTKAREMMKQQASTDEVWTGLRYLAGQWEWVGGGEVKYNGLDMCPALRSCGVLSKYGEARFNTWQCNQKKNFLCDVKH